MSDNCNMCGKDAEIDAWKIVASRVHNMLVGVKEEMDK
jgi:hypothetical protein